MNRTLCGVAFAVALAGFSPTVFAQQRPLVTEDPELARELPEPHNGHGRWQGAFRTGHFDAVAHARAVADAGSGSGDEDAVTLPPLLVVHDHRDGVIPFSQGRAIAAAWQGAELLSTTGLGHHRILRDPQVVRSAVDFLGSAAVSAPAQGSRAVAR